MASNKSSKSEGPFILVTRSPGSPELANGSSLYSTYYATREELDKFIEQNKATQYSYLVFEGVAKVTFEHEVVRSPING